MGYIIKVRVDIDKNFKKFKKMVSIVVIFSVTLKKDDCVLELEVNEG